MATDDNVEITSVSVERINDDSEGIILTTDDDIQVANIGISNTYKDDSDMFEFRNDSDTETYAKIGTIDGSSGLFVDNIYDLNGNILIQLDPINDVMILFGKKYKLISYVEN